MVWTFFLLTDEPGLLNEICTRQKSREEALFGVDLLTVQPEVPNEIYTRQKSGEETLFGVDLFLVTDEPEVPNYARGIRDILDLSGT